jgi:hypothetical protein
VFGFSCQHHFPWPQQFYQVMFTCHKDMEEEKRYGEVGTEKRLDLLKLCIKSAEVSLLEACLGLGEEILKKYLQGHIGHTTNERATTNISIIGRH